MPVHVFYSIHETIIIFTDNCYRAVSLWNSLHNPLKLCNSSRSFKHKLRAKLFAVQFPSFGLSMLLSCNSSEYLLPFSFFDFCIIL